MRDLETVRGVCTRKGKKNEREWRMRENEEREKMRASFSFREERKSEMKERSTHLRVQIRDKFDDDDGERRISSLFQVNKLLYFLSLPFFYLSFLRVGHRVVIIVATKDSWSNHEATVFCFYKLARFKSDFLLLASRDFTFLNRNQKLGFDWSKFSLRQTFFSSFGYNVLLWY